MTETLFRLCFCARQIPLYCGYLLLRSLTASLFPGSDGSDEALALEEQEQALQAARKAKKKAKVSKNKTR